MMKLLNFNSRGRSQEQLELSRKDPVDDATVSTVTVESEEFLEKIEVIAPSSTTGDEYLACGLESCGFYGIYYVADNEETTIVEDDDKSNLTILKQEDAVEREEDDASSGHNAEDTPQELAQKAMDLNKRLLVTRGISIRKQLRELLYHESVALLQARVRGMLVRESYSRNQSSAVCIQRAVREHLHTRTGAAIMVQSVVRKALVRHHLQQATCSAIKLQAFVRATWARNYFLHAQRGATLLQAQTRGMIARSNLNDLEYERDNDSEASDDDTCELDDAPLAESWFNNDFTLGVGLDDLIDFVGDVGVGIDFVGDVGVGIDFVGEVDELIQVMMDRVDRNKGSTKIKMADAERSAVVIQALVRGVLVRHRLSHAGKTATPEYLTKQEDKFYC
jgi:hypothetical protein